MITPPLGRRDQQMQQPQQPNYIQGGPPQGGGGQMMQSMAQMGMKAALSGSPLAPLGGLLGFNKGGKVPWWQKVKNTVWGTGPKKGSIADQINWGGQNKNMGGPISAHPNPHGYNEGGAVGETPIKKVMDEQKLDQQAVAFERDQQRKQEAHDMAMKQKQQQFEMAQKMKKESAMTNKKPKPAGPLSGKGS